MQKPHTLLMIGNGNYGTFIHEALRDDFDMDITDGFDFKAADFTEEHACVATPHFTHYGIVADLLKSKKNVICEKPIALTVGEVEGLYVMAKENDCYLRTGFLFPHHPFYISIKKMQEKLGPIISIQVDNCSTENRADIDWYWDREKSGGWFLTSEIHWYYLFLWLTDSIDATVSHASEHANAADGRTHETYSEIENAGNQKLTVSHNLNCKDEEIACIIRIIFKDATIEIRGWIPDSMHVSDSALPAEVLAPLMPDIDSWSSTKDEEYQRLIRSNVSDMINCTQYDHRPVILAHALAIQAQEISDLALRKVE